MKEINYNEIDSECRDMVEYFNKVGLPTEFSCQGHGNVAQSLFYITFDSCVKEEDILNFQLQHLDERGNFCANGHFAKRIFAYTEYTKEGKAVLMYTDFWEYVAGTIKAAHSDLMRWSSMKE